MTRHRDVAGPAFLALHRVGSASRVAGRRCWAIFRKQRSGMAGLVILVIFVRRGAHGPLFFWPARTST